MLRQTSRRQWHFCGCSAMAISAVLLLGVALTAVEGVRHVRPCDDRSVIVQLFEWKWTDVAAECKAFLGPKQYCAVQVSPPSEHAVFPGGPWRQRYQPVSYIIKSRSGTQEQFQHMVDTCRDAGVRIIAEVVLNNMASMSAAGEGLAGSQYDATRLSFPAVPYDENDFNNASLCGAKHKFLNEAEKKRNCPVHGLADLDQSRENVRDSMRDYLDRLVDLGVVGFSVPSAKHMWPQDLAAILGSVKDLPGGSRPFFLMQVADYGNSTVKVEQYNDLGFVTEYRFAQKLAQGMADFRKLGKIVNYSAGMVFSSNAVVFVDDYGTQRFVPGTLTFRQPRQYAMATTFTLAYGYGTVRLMSSYEFIGVNQGPPSSSNDTILDVGTDQYGWCQNGWVCEHRWRAISDLIPFHNAVRDKDLNHFTATNDLVYFTRGRSGFFAMTSRQSFVGYLPTGLAPGEYCELILNCEYTIKVNDHGLAYVNMSADHNPILAILNKKAPENKFQRTVILMEKPTQPGEYVFFRGGIDHSRREGCTEEADTSACAIPIHIRHVDLNISAAYDAWRAGDSYLDWYGMEADQSVFQNWRPEGSPGLWTTNDVNDEERFHSLNTYGPHYWLLDMDMDCSKTEQGVFEFKGLVNGQWEGTIYNNQCEGAEPLPFASANHVATCGAVNVFHWNEGRCQTYEL